MQNSVYDFIEFIAFIVPRCLQFTLGIFTQLDIVGDTFAMNMYRGLSYLCAIVLVLAGVFMVRQSVHQQAIVINRYTAGFLVQAMVLFSFAGFTAAAPTTGLSLKYCAKVAANFVRFEDPH